MDKLFKSGFLKSQTAFLGYITGLALVITVPDLIFEEYFDKISSYLELPIIYKSSNPPNTPN